MFENAFVSISVGHLKKKKSFHMHILVPAIGAGIDGILSLTMPQSMLLISPIIYQSLLYSTQIFSVST